MDACNKIELTNIMYFIVKVTQEKIICSFKNLTQKKN